MTRSRWFRLLAALFAFTLFAAACGNDDDDGADDDDDDAAAVDDGADDATPPGDFEPISLNFGALLPQTGDLASIVEALESGIRLAEADINADFDGLITIEVADSGTSPDVAAENVDRYLTGAHHAILGPAASGVTGAIVDKVQTAEVVQCTGSATAAALGEKEPYFIRTAPSDELQAPTLGDLIIADEMEDVAVIWRNDDYGVGFGEALADYLQGSGVTVTLREGYDPDASSFAQLVSDVANSGAEALAMITFAEGGQLVLDLQGRFDGQIYVADGYADTVGEEQLGGDATLQAGFRGTQPAAAPASGEATFPGRFAEFAPDVPTIFSAQFYDCVVIMALAAQAAQSNDPAVFVNELVNVTRDGEKCTSFSECYALLAAGEDIDYDGASGPLEFSDNGEPTVGSYDLYEFDDEGVKTTFDQTEFSIE